MDSYQYVLDSHTHTLASGHAYNTITEMAQAAADKGLSLLAITEHGPAMPGGPHAFYFLNLRVVRRKKAGIPVLFGCECNIIDSRGTLDLPEDALAQLDVGIASIHPPCYRAQSRDENTEAYIRAMQNPAVNIIGHPDDARFPVDYLALVQAAGEHHVLLEVNNSSLNPNGYRPGAKENDTQMLKLCKKYEQPVILGSDAHVEEDVANFCYADELVRSLNFPPELIANTSVDLYLSYLTSFHPESHLPGSR